MKRSLLLITVLAAGILIAQADPVSQFDEGLVQYRSDNWEQAVAIWEQILAQGDESGALHYNLGNAYYRLHELGKAVLEYERASRLTPRDDDVRQNLEFVRLRVIDRVEEPLRLSIWETADRIRDSVTIRELSLALLVTGLLVTVLLGLRWYGPVRIRRVVHPLLVGAIAVYVIGGAWYGWRSALDSQPWAIVMAEKTSVHSGPDETSTELFALHEGTRVAIDEELSVWMRVRLADGRMGWMMQTDLEEI